MSELTTKLLYRYIVAFGISQPDADNVAHRIAKQVCLDFDLEPKFNVDRIAARIDLML